MLLGQTGSIYGIISLQGQPVEYAQVATAPTHFGAVSNAAGEFKIHDLPYGTYWVTASYVGYEDVVTEVTISASVPDYQLMPDLKEQTLQLDELVITGTKTYQRRTNSPVIVNVVNSKTIANVQACNLSEGLRFQPGLRVETDCQTCNYTQLRMNGLTGGYSQILINGRPIFSPLTGLYGMEQLPANMIDRIEVVRGGGSSLYGSSAIGGTVNVITKVPRSNSYQVDYNYQSIGGQTSDRNLSGNATLVSENKTAGMSLFVNRRDRGFYDANDDNFSEIPTIENTALGTNLFVLPSENQKLELSLSTIREYRFGGEMVTDKPPHLTQQAEERTHRVWMANADYQLNFNNDNSSLITYLAWQHTDRDHYTGILPDIGTPQYELHINNPPYGTSEVTTYNVGMQINHKINGFLTGSNMITAGAEYVYDDVLDDIPAYDYLIDQTTKDVGVFVQSDWQLLPQLTLLSGVRVDKHNLVDQLLASPRASLLYKLRDNTQFRLSYGTGFRAPQAFDTDLHIAFSGGGVSRISLSSDLREERSQSISASVNYDKVMEKWVAGLTAESFHNRLHDAFYLQPIGEDQFGEQFVKQNGDGATVQGLTMELRANYNRKVQLEGGFTLQSSRFDEPVQYIDEIAGIRDYIRTPDSYGYSILTLTPNSKWSAAINYVYTGSMLVPHFAGAANQSVDEIVTSQTFSEVSLKLGYTISKLMPANDIEVYAGVKNIFDAYQDDFDIGKNRDSNYIYGPGQPRTFYIGMKMKSR